MTQANTFENIREELQDNIVSVAKRVIFFGNNAYFWSTENGYEFFVEQSLPINEKNYNTLNDWIDTYGTDTYTLGIIRDIQALRNEEARKRSYIKSLRERGVELRSAANNRFDGLQRLATAYSAGTDGDSVAHTERQEDFGPVAIQDDWVINSTDYEYKIKVNPNYIQYDNNYKLFRVTDEGLKHIREVKAPSKDAWWDMDDIKSKDSLDDTIANEVTPKRSPIEGDMPVIDNFEEDLYRNYHNLFVEDGYAEYIEDNIDLPSFMTPQGEVYGFVDKDGNIYLDETKINAEHPIHEYTHLWDRAVQQNNPDFWNRGVSIMTQTPLWNEILNNCNCGKKWQPIKGNCIMPVPKHLHSARLQHDSQTQAKSLKG